MSDRMLEPEVAGAQLRKFQMLVKFEPWSIINVDAVNYINF